MLFSTAMVQAILDSRKTMTRRVVKLPKKARWGTEYEGQVIFDDGSTFGHEMAVDEMRCPYGQFRDRLWVREAWELHDPLDVPEHRHGKVAPFVGCQGSDEGIKRKIHWVAVYRADGELQDHPEYGKFLWRPSIFMPRWASRILLEITSVRVERLHEITEEDALAEGITKTDLGFSYCENSYYTSAKEAYESLWKSINGVKSWVDNPWVWVITFKVVEIKR